jgi:hypothetical protein
MKSPTPTKPRQGDASTSPRPQKSGRTTPWKQRPETDKIDSIRTKTQQVRYIHVLEKELLEANDRLVKLSNKRTYSKPDLDHCMTVLDRMSPVRKPTGISDSNPWLDDLAPEYTDELGLYNLRMKQLDLREQVLERQINEDSIKLAVKTTPMDLVTELEAKLYKISDEDVKNYLARPGKRSSKTTTELCTEGVTEANRNAIGEEFHHLITGVKDIDYPRAESELLFETGKSKLNQSVNEDVLRVQEELIDLEPYMSGIDTLKANGNPNWVGERRDPDFQARIEAVFERASMPQPTGPRPKRKSSALPATPYMQVLIKRRMHGIEK